MPNENRLLGRSAHTVVFDDAQWAVLPPSRPQQDPLRIIGFDPSPFIHVDYSSLERRILESVARATQLPLPCVQVQVVQPDPTHLDININVQTDLDASHMSDVVQVALGIVPPKKSLWDHLLEEAPNSVPDRGALPSP